MKVWVVVDFDLKMFNDLVFSTKDNVINWWSRTHADEIGGEILERPADPPYYPRRLFLGYKEDPFYVAAEAREIEVDAWFMRDKSEDREKEQE